MLRQGSIDEYGDTARTKECTQDQHRSIGSRGIAGVTSGRVSRMRERIEMKSKMLGALALLTLIGALFVMQSAEQQSATTVDAATGTIAALNVGTCLTTDTDVPSFSGDCGALDDSVEGRDIRDKITEVSTLYATYAHDPKTASEEPRAILKDSDLLKISIKDEGRDKRTGVLIRGASNDTKLTDDNTDGSLGKVIRDDLTGLKVDFDTGDPDKTRNGGTNDDDVIKFTSDEHDGTDTGEDGIEVYQNTEGIASVILDSGNHTLNFKRHGKIGDTTKDWQFDPADFDVANGAVVRFYGCIEDDGQSDCAGKTIEKLDELSVDEDASNGNASGDIAPWLGVNASVPTGKDIVILAIYYRTSSEENLVGGQAYWTCPDVSGKTVSPTKERTGDPPTDNWRCGYTSATSIGTAAGHRDAPKNVVYTAGERTSNAKLVVRAKSDGDVTEQDLFLTETSRFSGVYQGFVRLTDANGDGRGDGSTRMDWGHQTEDGKNAKDPSDPKVTEAMPAVLGVESGPVTIEYQDSDGNVQRLRIDIDNRPPVVTITAPTHNGASDDQSPDFSGRFEDGDSGLADDSFRLVVDNEVDTTDGINGDWVLTGKAPNADKVVSRNASRGVTHIGDYSGYTNPDPTVGIVPASELYNLGDDSCSNRDLCHILAEPYSDGATSSTFDDTLRLDLRRNNQDVDIRDKEFQIDFQAYVLDMAGNVGFSDADPTNPRFINDLGKTTGRNVPSVLGYYSAHITTLDEKDPELIAAKTTTGLYGRVSSDNFTTDRSGIRVAFDGPIDPASVTNDTFSVTLDDGTAARVIDHDVDKNWVFLKLSSELASDATPMIDIVAGGKVEDLAGNETFGREVDAFEANDGISPRLTVTLSGGSGKGTGSEGSDKLTKDTITVHVSSDEDLQSAPRIVAVCNNLRWNEGGTVETDGRVFENRVGTRHDIDDFVANRNKSSEREPGETPVETKPRSTNTTPDAGTHYKYTCGYESHADWNFPDNFMLTPVFALSRPGNNWEYTWQNQVEGTSQHLEDGKITVVAYGRDRGGYDNLENWGSSSAEFTLDTELKNPLNSGDLQPADGGKSKEARPFVLIEFDESTTVTLDSVELDNVEISSLFESPDTNRFVYWPLSMSQGEHDVEVDASDAAGNTVSFSYDFEILARGDFVISLNAGWNAISVPADPNDTAIGSVFTDPAVTTVIGWDTQGWRIATRRDGVWESNQSYGALNEIRAMYGYWVKSDNFVRQPVALRGGNARDTSGTPILVSIPTEPGWNFVGVVDQDGDQTEDDFGNSLKGSDNAMIPAKDYLGSTYVRAYSWDATFSRFDVIRPDDVMSIGDGVWVYYPEGTGIAP